MVRLFKKSNEESSSSATENNNNGKKESWSTKMKSAFCCGGSSHAVKDPKLIQHSQSRRSRGSIEVSPMTTRADSSARGSVVTDLDCEFRQAPMTTSLLADEHGSEEKTGRFHLFGHRRDGKELLKK